VETVGTNDVTTGVSHTFFGLRGTYPSFLMVEVLETDYEAADEAITGIFVNNISILSYCNPGVDRGIAYFPCLKNYEVSGMEDNSGRLEVIVVADPSVDHSPSGSYALQVRMTLSNYQVDSHAPTLMPVGVPTAAPSVSLVPSATPATAAPTVEDFYDVQEVFTNDVVQGVHLLYPNIVSKRFNHLFVRVEIIPTDYDDSFETANVTANGHSLVQRCHPGARNSTSYFTCVVDADVINILSNGSLTITVVAHNEVDAYPYKGNLLYARITVSNHRQMSAAPTTIPTSLPTSPTSLPSGQPSRHPSESPSGQPSYVPTGQPTCEPTSKPSTQPSSQPSGRPTGQPSGFPTSLPSGQPSGQPTGKPSGEPSGQPSGLPTGEPTGQPSGFPTSQPSGHPASVPTAQPTGHPSAQPTSHPSTHPSGLPTGQPTAVPTVVPSFTYMPTAIYASFGVSVYTQGISSCTGEVEIATEVLTMLIASSIPKAHHINLTHSSVDACLHARRLKSRTLQAASLANFSFSFSVDVNDFVSENQDPTEEILGYLYALNLAVDRGETHQMLVYFCTNHNCTTMPDLAVKALKMEYQKAVSKDPESPPDSQSSKQEPNEVLANLITFKAVLIYASVATGMALLFCAFLSWARHRVSTESKKNKTVTMQKEENKDSLFENVVGRQAGSGVDIVSIPLQACCLIIGPTVFFTVFWWNMLIRTQTFAVKVLGSIGTPIPSLTIVYLIARYKYSGKFKGDKSLQDLMLWGHENSQVNVFAIPFGVVVALCSIIPDSVALLPWKSTPYSRITKFPDIHMLKMCTYCTFAKEVFFTVTTVLSRIYDTNVIDPTILVFTMYFSVVKLIIFGAALIFKLGQHGKALSESTETVGDDSRFNQYSIVIGKLQRQGNVYIKNNLNSTAGRTLFMLGSYIHKVYDFVYNYDAFDPNNYRAQDDTQNGPNICDEEKGENKDDVPEETSENKGDVPADKNDSPPGCCRAMKDIYTLISAVGVGAGEHKRSDDQEREELKRHCNHLQYQLKLAKRVPISKYETESNLLQKIGSIYVAKRDDISSDPDFATAMEHLDVLRENRDISDDDSDSIPCDKEASVFSTDAKGEIDGVSDSIQRNEKASRQPKLSARRVKPLPPVEPPKKKTITLYLPDRDDDEEI